MLNESVFVKDKLNDIGYQEVLRGELWPFIEFFIEFIFQNHFSLNWIEMEDKKTIFPIRRCSYSYSRHYAQVVSKFPKRIIIMTKQMNPDLNPIENLWRILTKKVYNQEKPPIESIVELKKKIKNKIHGGGYLKRNLNKLVDSIAKKLIKNKGKLTNYLTKT